MEFFSMGMFILDEIEFKDRTEHDIIGGAGTYAVVAAGMFAPAAMRNSVGMFIDMGSDFPSQVRKEIDSWRLGIILRSTPDRKTTRGWNGYKNGEHREFEYLTPGLRIEAADLVGSPRISSSKSIHLICSPQRCLEICEGLASARKDLRDQYMIWEPVPSACSPQHLDALFETFVHVSVLSPNAKEAAMFFGLPEPSTRAEVERVATHFSAYKGILIIRCGNQGCLCVSSGLRTWYPPYHTSVTHVIDPTGAGNSFLGGLGAGLSWSSDLHNAIVFATVAASFAIEQIGIPHYDPVTDICNGEKVQERIRRYQEIIR